jgi:molybdopterin-containing oxidoreductase family membrane subunit
MKPVGAFLAAGVRELFRGGPRYWAWVGTLLAVIGAGAVGYRVQLARGLVATGLSDQISWGVYMPIEALVEPMRAEAAAAFGGPVDVATDLARLEL